MLSQVYLGYLTNWFGEGKFRSAIWLRTRCAISYLLSAIPGLPRLLDKFVRLRIYYCRRCGDGRDARSVIQGLPGLLQKLVWRTIIQILDMVTAAICYLLSLVCYGRDLRSAIPGLLGSSDKLSWGEKMQVYIWLRPRSAINVAIIGNGHGG